jgi:hypothetical protein
MTFPVTHPLAWSYTVDPYGWAVANFPPAAQYNGGGELLRGIAPQVRLPWNPLAYPAVGSLPPGLGAAAAPAAAINENPARVKAPRPFAHRLGG